MKDFGAANYNLWLASISIFRRFGKFLKQMDSSGIGLRRHAEQ